MQTSSSTTLTLRALIPRVRAPDAHRRRSLSVSHPDLTPDLIARAVRGDDKGAVRAVVRALTPILQARVARVLLRARGAARGRDVRQEVQDQVQDVFESLLSDGGRRLLAWAPELGSAATFFGLVAERRVLNTLASRRQSPWTEDPSEADDLDASEPPPAADVERLVASRELLQQVGRRLRDSLNERDQRLFELMYVHQLDDDAIRADLGLQRDALYQARRRLKQRVRQIVRDQDGGA